MYNTTESDRYEKYKIGNLPESQLSPLSYILRKAEVGLNLTDAEWHWLVEHQLNETSEVISDQEQYRKLLLSEIRGELIELKKNPFVRSIFTIPSADSDIALTLYKINVGEKLIDSEMRYVFDDYIRFLDFNDKKLKYGIIEDIPFGGKTNDILSKIDKNLPLNTSEIGWIITRNAHSFVTLLEEQFRLLQIKYKANVQDEYSNNLLLLLYILQKIDEKIVLTHEENQYLRENGFLETLQVSQQIEFSSLKLKYNATQDQENDINCHLYKVLRKIDSNSPLPESDVNFLKKRKLYETIKLAFKKDADILVRKVQEGIDLSKDEILWCETYFFEEILLNWLKKKYEVKSQDCSSESRLFAILKKLDTGNRLKDEEVVWLEGEKLLQRSRKIYICHHTLEALFYENEFKRLRDFWKLASASAQWRKAEKPLNAIKLTGDLIIEKIKPAKLRAALLTTQGGALRDIGDLDEAEKSALKAIKNFPDSHNPYTLMGALCYDTGRHDEGYKWFDEAVKRGAQPNDQDSEIKRILRKGQNHSLIEYLLKKDPFRFAWVKEFAKNIFNRKKS
jgi:tetratricopeptide (TPR) repeat protein